MEENSVDILMEVCLDLEEEIKAKQAELKTNKENLLLMFEENGIVKQFNAAGFGYKVVERATADFTSEATKKVIAHGVAAQFVKVSKKGLEDLKKSNLIEEEAYNDVMSCYRKGIPTTLLQRVEDKKLRQKVAEQGDIPF